MLLFTRWLTGRSEFDKIVSNRGRLRLVACVVVLRLQRTQPKYQRTQIPLMENNFFESEAVDCITL